MKCILWKEAFPLFGTAVQYTVKEAVSNNLGGQKFSRCKNEWCLTRTVSNRTALLTYRQQMPLCNWMVKSIIWIFTRLLTLTDLHSNTFISSYKWQNNPKAYFQLWEQHERTTPMKSQDLFAQCKGMRNKYFLVTQLSSKFQFSGSNTETRRNLGPCITKYTGVSISI